MVNAKRLVYQIRRASMTHRLVEHAIRLVHGLDIRKTLRHT